MSAPSSHQTKQPTGMLITQGMLSVISKLPLSLLQLVAYWFSLLLVLLPGQKLLRTIERNLLLAFPEWDDTQREQTAKLALQAQCQSMVEFIKTWGSPTSYSIAQIQHVDGEALLHEALESKQGLILILPHFGSWEMMNAWFSQFISMVIMYKPDENQAINQFVLEARSRLNATLVPANESGVRQLFKALKQGGCIAVLPDHIPEQSGGIYSPFFGRPVFTSTLVSKLAQKTQCRVLQVSCMRQSDDHGFSICIENVHDDIRSSDLQQSVDALNLSMETLIRRHPEHYHWNYKRFKKLPLLDQAYYAEPAIALTLANQASQKFDYATQHLKN